MMIFPRSHLVHHWATLQDNTHRTENLLKQVLHFTYENTYRHWTHVQTYGTDVFAVDMLSSISQAGGDKSMKPMAFDCVFILVLRRFLPDS